MKKIVYIIAMIGIMSLFLAGCAKKDSDSSSSSASTSTSTSSNEDVTVAAASGSGALTLSSKVSLVSANGDASASSRTAFSHFSTDNFTSGEDITVDETETFVYERSADVKLSVLK
jgi:ABC-type enterochelin transport system substrate-binding protein